MSAAVAEVKFKMKFSSLRSCVLCGLVFLFLASSATLGQSNSSTSSDTEGFGPINPAPPDGGLKTDDILARVGAKETLCRDALANYTWTQDIRESTMDGKKVTGEYHVVQNITFDSNKKRTERVTFAPMDTLKDVIMTPNDVEELEHKDAFPLTEENLNNYSFTYVGRQKVDDVDTYVFDVKPKVLDKKRLRFQGRVWVDQQESQILVSSGTFVPQDTRPGHEDLSPPFTTYREQIDAKYWFPVYTHGEGVLHFHATRNSMSDDVHMRQIIKYTDYKQFGSSIRIIYPSEEEKEKQTK